MEICLPLKMKVLIQFYVELPIRDNGRPAICPVGYSAKSAGCHTGGMYVTGNYKLKRFGGLVHQDKWRQRMVVIKRNFWHSVIGSVSG